MGNYPEMSWEQKWETVLMLLSREESAAALVRRVAELERALAEREKVIGELTMANRFLKKRSGFQL